jgi:hypothetical protein
MNLFSYVCLDYGWWIEQECVLNNTSIFTLSQVKIFILSSEKLLRAWDLWLDIFVFTFLRFLAWIMDGELNR